MKIPLYSQDGAKKGDLDVSEKIFGKKPNPALIHKVLIIQLGNKRHPIAHTKTKGEVRGGGRKPYRQKHTGWARQGSIRNPHFKGGGVTFGPRSVRNFHRRIPKKERRNALLSALSAKYQDGHISALEGFTLEKPKTKTFVSLLNKLPFKKEVLFVMEGKNGVFLKSSRNVPRAKSIPLNNMNLVDILKYNDVVFFKDALEKFQSNV